MALTKIDDRGLTTPIDLLDNEKIRFGTGNDLEIHHNGTDTYISHTGSGVFRIEGNGSNSIALRAKTGENSLTLNPDGAVELYYNNSKKLETWSGGVTVTGNLNLNDSDKLALGSSGTDLQIYHDGSDSYVKHSGAGNFYVQTSEASVEDLYLQAGNDVYIRVQTGETAIKAIGDGAVELYSDGVKKFETTSGGAKVTGFLNVTTGIHIPDGGDNDSSISIGGGNDLRLYHDGSNSVIKDSGTGLLAILSSALNITNAAGTEDGIKFVENGAVSLYYDNSRKFYTTANGTRCDDNVKISVGDGGDMNIYHNGTDSYLDNATGRLLIPSAEIDFMSADQNEWIIKSFQNGGVELYYDNSKKFETTSGGAKLSGTLLIGRDSAGNTGNGHTLRDSDSCIFSRNSDTGETVQISRNTNDSKLVQFRAGDSGNATQIGHIDKSGSGVTYNSDSDYRKKENDVVISDGITKLKQLRPIRFNYKDNPDKTFDGFFAHEVHPVVPEIVTGTKDAVVTQDDIDNGDYEQSEKDDPKYQSMDYGRLTPLLTAALQEAITKIETLETKVAALKAK